MPAGPPAPGGRSVSGWVGSSEFASWGALGPLVWAWRTQRGQFAECSGLGRDPKTARRALQRGVLRRTRRDPPGAGPLRPPQRSTARALEPRPSSASGGGHAGPSALTPGRMRGLSVLICGPLGPPLPLWPRRGLRDRIELTTANWRPPGSGPWKNLGCAPKGPWRIRKPSENGLAADRSRAGLGLGWLPSGNCVRLEGC